MKDIFTIIFILTFGLNLFILNGNSRKEEIINVNNEKNIVENNIEKTIENTVSVPNLKVQLKKRDRDVVEDTLVAPEKRVESHQYTDLKLYERTRGEPDEYHLFGVIYNETVNKTYQLFGRRTYPGSPLFEYYYRGKDAGGLDFKFPLPTNKEIYDGDVITLPTDNLEFKVKIYPNDLPRYNPYVF